MHVLTTAPPLPTGVPTGGPSSAELVEAVSAVLRRAGVPLGLETTELLEANLALKTALGASRADLDEQALETTRCREQLEAMERVITCQVCDDAARGHPACMCSPRRPPPTGVHDAARGHPARRVRPPPLRHVRQAGRRTMPLLPHRGHWADDAHALVRRRRHRCGGLSDEGWEHTIFRRHGKLGVDYC